MNRRLILPFLVLFFGTIISGFSQASGFRQEVFLGPKIGFTVQKAKFNFPEQEDLFEQKWQTGYQIGGAFAKPLKNIFHFYTEFYFAQKGKKTIIVENGLVNQSKYYFLEAPILLRLQFEGGAPNLRTMDPLLRRGVPGGQRRSVAGLRRPDGRRRRARRTRSHAPSVHDQ